MKKKLIASLLMLAILIPLWCSQITHASPTPSLQLSYNGNEAVCTADIRGAGRIEAQMELWQGTTQVFAWSGVQNNHLAFDESCDVLAGCVYTLKLNGTINGVPFQELQVTRRNWEMNK